MGTTRVVDCLCREEFFYHDQMERCERCPIGANCTDRTGITLESLPLLPGYWRWRHDVKDILRCPGATGRENEESTTGCIGSVSGNGSYCKPSLDGPYCSLCNQEYALGVLNGTSVYLDKNENACRECGDFTDVIHIGAWSLLAVLLLVWIVARVVRVMQAIDSPWTNRWVDKWHRMSSRVERIARGGRGLQLREGLSFIQVLTNLQEIYALRFPTEFLRFTEVLGSLVSIAAPLPPLACMGLEAGS